MDFSEIEFLAEDEIIEIIPNFSTKKPIELFAGPIGPLEAGLTTNVPLWAATFLKQRHRCKIIPPEWMNTDSLENLKIKETEDRFLIRLPSVHMFEISQLILQHASNDVPSGDKIKTLLMDIMDIRASKLRNSMDLLFKSGQSHAQVDNLTPLEICRTRPLLVDASNHLRKMKLVYSQTMIDDDVVAGNRNDSL